MRKQLSRLLLVTCFLIALSFAWHHLYFWATDGFNLANIQYDIHPDSRWEIAPLTTPERQDIDHILSQPFTYLAKGHQAYVFQSQDGKTVLKFLKFQRLRIKPWYAGLPLPDFLAKKRSQRADFKREKLELLLNSWVICFNVVKTEMGLLAIHINPTEGQFRPVQIVDKMGRSHTVDLDHTVFALQSKVEIMLPEKIESLMQTGAVSQAKQLLDNLISFYLSEYRRGFTEADHHIMRNTGFVELTPIHIDLGQFVQDEGLKNPAVYSQQILWKTAELRTWLDKHYPLLSAYFKQKLAELQ